MLFTIITVCYNSEKTIERTMESVLNQTCQDYEYIIVDGASTDGTMELVHKYEPRFQGRMRWISEKDQGIYDAMNKGIHMAKGELIGIVNSDDYYEPNALEIMKNLYTGYEYSILYGAVRAIDDGRERMVYIKNHEFIEQDMITHPSCFISKSLYDTFGVYSQEYPYSADYEFMLRIRNENRIRYFKTYEIITNFVDGGASNSRLGYWDTVKLLYHYHLIGKKQYYYERVKTWLAIRLKGK